MLSAPAVLIPQPLLPFWGYVSWLNPMPKAAQKLLPENGASGTPKTAPAQPAHSATPGPAPRSAAKKPPAPRRGSAALLHPARTWTAGTERRLKEKTPPGYRHRQTRVAARTLTRSSASVYRCSGTPTKQLSVRLNRWSF